ncbi:MAG: hypothetical protein LBD13_00785 [Spirochaetaceae bacterium]|jgi:hypothetical protein|nr:hypothetical protein [Spirochaetaceae bacterium]
MTLQILPKEARSADNSLYDNDLYGDRIVYCVLKTVFLVANKTPAGAAGGRAQRRQPLVGGLGELVPPNSSQRGAKRR